MRRKFRGKPASVFIAPEQLCVLPVIRNTDKAQICLRVAVHILKILAGAGDQKIFSDQSRRIKPQRQRAQDVRCIQIFLRLSFIQQQADIAAVTLIPAQSVHIGGGLPHLRQKRSRKNIIHFLIPSYSEFHFHICGPPAATDHPPAHRSGGSIHPRFRRRAWFSAPPDGRADR